MSTKRCPWCDQPIRGRRSQAISKRFHAHTSWMTRELAGQCSWDEVKTMALQRAMVIPPPPGGKPYRRRSEYPEEWRVPIDTRDATNAEMMTACEALVALCLEWGIGLPPERHDLERLIEEAEL